MKDYRSFNDYTVINPNGKRSYYSRFIWNLCWWLVYGMGIIVGLILSKFFKLYE